ncbi:MAG: 50S ribosomal protein L29 [Planctomycetota bacterium]|nr:50S ribosomal protein L29 [Planctomycetota bacterium]
MDIDEIRSSTDEELKRRYIDVRKEFFQLQIRFTTEQVENPRQKQDLRRELARIKTILRQRELEAESANA